MNFLLDTNVVSELSRPRPDRRILSWLTQNEQRCLISVVVLGELTYGAERIRDATPARAERLDDWRSQTVAVFEDRLVDVDREIAEEWGRLAARVAGTPITPDDALIAATALVHDWTLATRNTKHFERTGVRLVNPFEA